jgi:hypothetical protein
MEPMYYITNSPSGEGVVVLVGNLLYDNYYSNEVLAGRARLYAVFDLLEQQTRSTNEFVLFHDNGTCLSVRWTDSQLACQSDIPHIPIPLTCIHHTSNPQLSELSHTDNQRLDRIEMLAVNELNQMKTSFKVQKRIADLVIKDAIQQKLSCSITMTPFTPETATCVAPCYHIFDKDAITTWLETKDTCPECRERCSL